MIARRFVARGRVQGVGFRAWTRRRARKHGVVGWVRNNPDRTVEGRVQGPGTAVEAFLDDLRRGPVLGRVDRLDVEDTAPLTDDAFEIRR